MVEFRFVFWTSCGCSPFPAGSKTVARASSQSQGVLAPYSVWARVAHDLCCQSWRNGWPGYSASNLLGTPLSRVEHAFGWTSKLFGFTGGGSSRSRRDTYLELAAASVQTRPRPTASSYPPGLPPPMDEHACDRRAAGPCSHAAGKALFGGRCLQLRLAAFRGSFDGLAQHTVPNNPPAGAASRPAMQLCRGTGALTGPGTYLWGNRKCLLTKKRDTDPKPSPHPRIAEKLQCFKTQKEADQGRF